jgi:hypothetical protein
MVKSPKSPKNVDALTRKEARRLNVPTAEMRPLTERQDEFDQIEPVKAAEASPATNSPAPRRNPYREREEQAWQKLGQLHAAWDSIEELLYIIFYSFIDEGRERLLRNVFFSQQSHSARRAMVKEAAKIVLSQSEYKRFTGLMKRVKARADERNRVTHSSWHCNRDPVSKHWDLVRKTLCGEGNNHKPITLSQISTFTKSMDETAIELTRFVAPLFLAKTDRTIPREEVGKDKILTILRELFGVIVELQSKIGSNS